MNLKTIKLAFIASISILSTVFLVISCDDETTDPEALTSPVTFTFKFVTESNMYGNKAIYVHFATLDQTVPKVVVNGVEITRFSVGLAIDGSLDIPYSNIVNYSVSANEKVTTGSINIPDIVTTFSCNGSNIIGGTSIEKSQNYSFYWEGVDCDYQEFRYEYYGSSSVDYREFIHKDLAVFDVSNIPESVSNLSVSLYSISGFKPEVGANPNIKGTYGNGFVSASSKAYGDISLNSTLKAPNKSKESHKEFVENFIKVANQINKK